MSKNLLFETKTVLAELKNYRKSIMKRYRRIEKYDTYILIDSYRKGSLKRQFYLRKRCSKGKKYINEDSIGIVDLIREQRYLQELIKTIDNDIRLLEELDQNYVIPEFMEINARLPKVYRGEKPPVSAPATEAAEEWKRRMKAEKAKHEPYKPEDLIFPANDGTMMRSLSEVLIANYLLSLGITFVYELPIIRNGKKKWPDFTILSPIDNKTIIIIEHQGAMTSESYQDKFLKTVLFYLGTELVPNKNVFFTFNHLDRHLDLRQVDSILHTAFGFDVPQAA